MDTLNKDVVSIVNVTKHGFLIFDHVCNCKKSCESLELVWDTCQRKSSGFSPVEPDAC